MCSRQSKMDKIGNILTGLLLLAFIIAILMSGGCSAPNTLSVISSSTNLYYYYEDGEVVNFIDQAKLSDLELTQAIEALDQIDRSKKKLMVYKDQPLLLIQDISAISFQYVKIKGSYLSIKSIITDHWGEYTIEQQLVFIQFDIEANKLDDSFTKMTKSINVNQSLKIALQIAETTFKIAARI